LDEPSTRQSPMVAPYDGDLYMLVDVYKHHWDLFIKGSAIYLFACSIVAGYTLNAGVGVFQKLFAGLSVAVASVVAIAGISISLRFLNSIAERIDKACDRHGYLKIPFSGPKGIVRLFRWAAWLLLITGLLYVAHVLIVEGGAAHLKDLYATGTFRLSR